MTCAASDTLHYMTDGVRGAAADLYDRVVSERSRQGITWSQLAQRSGVARSTISNWATNLAFPQPGTVNAVADILGIPRDEALRLAGVLSDRVPENAPLCNLEEMLLAEELPDRIKAEVIRIHRERGHKNCDYQDRIDGLARKGAVAVS